jgi:hypothetical protein
MLFQAKRQKFLAPQILEGVLKPLLMNALCFFFNRPTRAFYADETSSQLKPENDNSCP